MSDPNEQPEATQQGAGSAQDRTGARGGHGSRRAQGPGTGRRP